MRYSKQKLNKDICEINKMVIKKAYYMTFEDYFALGYMCGKYNLSRLLADKKALKSACEQYDKTDDLKLLDTIKETLIDLKILK